MVPKQGLNRDSFLRILCWILCKHHIMYETLKSSYNIHECSSVMLLNHFESLFEFIIFMKIDIPHVDKEKWSFEYPFEFMYVYEKKCRPIGRDFMCMCIAWGSH